MNDNIKKDKKGRPPVPDFGFTAPRADHSFYAATNGLLKASTAIVVSKQDLENWDNHYAFSDKGPSQDI